MSKLIVFFGLGLLNVAALGRPVTEQVTREGLFIQTAISQPSATDDDIDQQAVPLYEKFLVKSSFADLKVTGSKATYSEQNGTSGWKWYQLTLVDGDGNQFSGFLSLSIAVSAIENPRTGKLTHVLNVRVPSALGTAVTKLYNFKGDVILRTAN